MSQLELSFGDASSPARSAAMLRRHFLSWDRPLLAQAVDWLARGWDGKGPLDLARQLIVVPTAQSGRRLREALAELAASRGQAVFPPRVVTPEALLVPENEATASKLVSLLAWTRVLVDIALADFREVFPLDPPARNFSWALRQGRMLSRLQATLAEAGLRIADVTPRAGRDFPEVVRWDQLAALEARHGEVLRALGFTDIQAAKIAIASNPPPLDRDRIVLLAVPDPVPLAVGALGVYAKTKNVEVVVFAPESEAANFDAWGRPLEPKWSGRLLALPDFDHRVHLMADPTAQAEQVAGLARQYDRPGTLGVGVVDSDVLPVVELAFRRAKVSAFNPEGRSRRHDSLYALLKALADFRATPDFAAVAALLRCPDVLTWLRQKSDRGFSSAQLLADVDRLWAKHLPPHLRAAQERAAGYPMAAFAITALGELRAHLAADDFSAGVSAALTELFGARRIQTDGVLAEAAEVWMDVVHRVAEAAAKFPGLLADDDKWELALEEYADGQRTLERPPEAVDLLGWLELLWDDSPHLVIAGLNDGRVPEAVVGDAFLPESLRLRLGLKSNAERVARDVYLLAALSASRVKDGRLDLMVGKTSTIGEPLRPSRLLFRCADAELPQRVERLFRGVQPSHPGRPWSRAWQLEVPRVPAPATVSVTAFRDWLACPFRFYLKHVLKMERVDPLKAELDPRDFGTLLHGALQQLAEEESLRACDDTSVLTKFLVERFEQMTRLRYGTELTLPLVVQFESARQRLRAAAEIEARERAAGWRTERAEWKFELPIGQLTIRGKIDRIDRHPDGRVRVLDYKTADVVKAPRQVHLRSPRESDTTRPEWMQVLDPGGKGAVWADLQLPLYLRAVAAEWGENVTAGYFTLPKAVTAAGILPWDDFSPYLRGAATRCTDSVAAAVSAGAFWPPVELPAREAAWDDFAELFHRGAEASVRFSDQGSATSPAVAAPATRAETPKGVRA